MLLSISVTVCFASRTLLLRLFDLLDFLESSHLTSRLSAPHTLLSIVHFAHPAHRTLRLSGNPFVAGVASAAGDASAALDPLRADLVALHTRYRYPLLLEFPALEELGAVAVRVTAAGGGCANHPIYIAHHPLRIYLNHHSISTTYTQQNRFWVKISCDTILLLFPTHFM